MAAKVCAIEGCGKRHEARGWCKQHYHRWRRHGDPSGSATEARFLEVYPSDGERRCARCREVKSIVEFRPNKAMRRGVSSYCRPCHVAAVLDHKRLKKYGLTPLAFDALLAAQGNACAICGATDAKWYVDHDHTTGAVRGVLCPRCNSGIGFMRDDTRILAAAIAYLEARR